MPRLGIEDSRRFIVDCLTSLGVSKEHATAQADLLIHADCCGHFSHGLNRLELYVNDLQNGATDPKGSPKILREAAATAWVDGADSLGAVVGNFCMDIAIRKAKEAGVGWVSAKRSNHFGMAGWWAKKAEKEGLIGMAFTNSSPLLVPTRAKEGALGTNPIAMAAPASGGDSIVVDQAMTTVALGKIEIQVRNGEPIPKGWALDSSGNVTTDAKVALDAGRLLPVGGFEETSGYKGYGLSAMVEAFCGGLSGANCANQVRPWLIEKSASPPNLGQCYAAINPNFFAPGFGDRMGDCLNHWRGMEPIDPELPVLAPGDKEKMNIKKTEAAGYIDYSQNQIDSCNKLSKMLNVKTVTVLKVV